MRAEKSSTLPVLTDLRQLYYFTQLAEYGSLSAAALALNMAQPSLSVSLARLESTLGLQLVVRSARGIDLTPSGHAVLNRTKRLLRQNQALIDLVTGLRKAGQPEINIGLSPSISSVLAVPLAETFHLEAPGGKLHVTEGMCHAMEELLLRNQLDVACSFAPPDPNLFISYPFITEDLFVVTAPDNWDEDIDEKGYAVRPITLKELCVLPLALPNNSYGGRKLIEDVLAKQNLAPNISMSIDGLQSLLQIAIRASAYTILPQSPLSAHMSQGRLAAVRVENNLLQRTCYLVVKREKQQSALLTRTLSIIFEITSELIKRAQLHAKIHEFRPI